MKRGLFTFFRSTKSFSAAVLLFISSSYLLRTREMIEPGLHWLWPLLATRRCWPQTHECSKNRPATTRFMVNQQHFALIELPWLLPSPESLQRRLLPPPEPNPGHCGHSTSFYKTQGPSGPHHRLFPMAPWGRVCCRVLSGGDDLQNNVNIRPAA